MTGLYSASAIGALLSLVCSSVSAAQQLVRPDTKAVRAASAVSSPEQPGDVKLSCGQILAEAQARQSEFTALLRQADDLTPDMSARTKALLAASEIASTVAPLSIPLGDPATAAAAAGASQAYMESAWDDTKKALAPLEKRIDFAEARGNYLNDLYRAKCHKTSKEQAAGAPLVQGLTASKQALPSSRMLPAPAPASGETNMAREEMPYTSTRELDCVALREESQRLRRQLDTEVGAMISSVQSYRPVGQRASRVANTATTIASALVPGLGAVLDTVRSGRKISEKAAREAQMSAFKNELQKQNHMQMAVAARITELEVAHQDRCQR